MSSAVMTTLQVGQAQLGCKTFISAELVDVLLLGLLWVALGFWHLHLAMSLLCIAAESCWICWLTYAGRKLRQLLMQLFQMPRVSSFLNPDTVNILAICN